MKLRITDGKGINQQFGFAASALLFGLVFFDIKAGSEIVVPVLAFSFLLIGLQTLLVRGGGNVSKKGKWKLNLIRNWLFIYSSIAYGLLNLGILSSGMLLAVMPVVDTLVLSTGVLMGVSVIQFITGGNT